MPNARHRRIASLACGLHTSLVWIANSPPPTPPSRPAPSRPKYGRHAMLCGTHGSQFNIIFAIYTYTMYTETCATGPVCKCVYTDDTNRSAPKMSHASRLLHNVLAVGCAIVSVRACVRVSGVVGTFCSESVKGLGRKHNWIIAAGSADTTRA